MFKRKKAPLCKGSWHGKAVTEGLLASLASNPSEFRFAQPTSPYTGEALNLFPCSLHCVVKIINPYSF